MNKQDILDKLKKVIYPGFSKDIVSFGFVKDVLVDGDKVFLSIDVTSSAKEVADKLKEDISNCLGIKDLTININAPKEARENSSHGKNIAPNIKNFLMLSSGKGGVGKSTASVNIAISLAMQGKKVGLLDADIYGPNIPRMLGFNDEKAMITKNNKIEPFNAYGVSMMSMGSLIAPSQALIWRGAMIMKAITQLLQDVNWGELDVLVIDMPPGTGDAQLTLAQSVPVTGGIVVSTPQQVSIDDSARSLNMFQKINIPILGIIENMSGFVCSNCDTVHNIFDSNTTNNIAKEFDTNIIAKIPIETLIREGGDTGKPITYFYPESVSAKSYMKCANDVWEQMESINKEDLANNSGIQPVVGTAGATTFSASASADSNKGGCGSGCGCH